MNKTIRNLVIFSIAALGCGFLGLAVDSASPPPDPMQGLGVLLWMLLPLLAVILLRAFGGDGWKDFGLKPNFKQSWIWYLFALLIGPLVIFLVTGLGAIFGFTSLHGFDSLGFAAYIPLVIAGFLAAMVKNIFEEFSWRGYLTPRLASLKVHPLVNSLLTGLVWAGWHIPYYLYFLGNADLQAQTHISRGAFILLVFLMLPLHALLYGELRLISGSVWPVWLLHTLSNAFALPLLAGGFISLRADFSGVLFNPGVQGVVHSLIIGGIGLGLYSYRKQKYGE